MTEVFPLSILLVQLTLVSSKAGVTGQGILHLHLSIPLAGEGVGSLGQIMSARDEAVIICHVLVPNLNLQGKMCFHLQKKIKIKVMKFFKL